MGIGYVLGRTRKMRFALGVAGAMMAKRSSDIPGELLERGTSLLKSSADLTQLTDTVRDELVGAARSAAVTAASNQLDALNTRLQQGSSLLSGESLLSGKDREAPEAESGDEGEKEPVREAAAASSDEDLEEVDSGQEEEGQEEEEDREPPAPRARKRAAPRARKTTSGTSTRKSAERKPVAVSRRRSSSDSDEPPVRRTRR
ncbi:hypothetical protein C5E45_17600 [Nocardia nova]|uniref:DNA primase n=1 Tax=Nocardia nova TaxID=37330 RepID=A0A2S6AP84_9NOCA|nr:hypothetical protein C5E41_12365 [Nocardia nova]PPJ37030.1 hypothetical protein C5E45_17600 [Nocardia nova]